MDNTNHVLDQSISVGLFTISTRSFQYPTQLLIIDDHDSHVHWEFIELCLEHNIIALCIPPHSAHLTQPLDVHLFTPFAQDYGREVDGAVRQGITSITKAIFLPLSQSAREKTFTPESILESFILYLLIRTRFEDSHGEFFETQHPILSPLAIFSMWTVLSLQKTL